MPKNDSGKAAHDRDPVDGRRNPAFGEAPPEGTNEPVPAGRGETLPRLVPRVSLRLGHWIIGAVSLLVLIALAVVLMR